MANLPKKKRSIGAPKQVDWKSLIPLLSAAIYLVIEIIKRL